MYKFKRIKGEGAITLVALVITIIILIVLAGVTIATLGGENGLIRKTIKSKEEYSISESKEKIELKIEELRIEQESKGEKITKEDLVKINNDEIDVKSIEKFPVEVICDKYKFMVDENFVVTYYGIAEGTIVTYTTEPEGYTTHNNILIKIKISNSNGIKKVKYPNDYEVNCNGKNTFAIDYSVQKNGTYTFKIIDKNNNEIQKDIVIEKIDTVNPHIIKASIEDITTNGFKINIEAEDGENTEDSIKSGIEKYEYYVKKSDDNDFVKYSSNDKNYIISSLEQETKYIVYVVVYDRAGNKAQTEEMEAITLAKMSKLYLVSEFEQDGKSVDISKGTEYSTIEDAVNAAKDGDILYFTEGKFEIKNTFLTSYNYRVAIMDAGKELTFCRRKR